MHHKLIRITATTVALRGEDTVCVKMALRLKYDKGWQGVGQKRGSRWPISAVQLTLAYSRHPPSAFPDPLEQIRRYVVHLCPAFRFVYPSTRPAFWYSRKTFLAYFNRNAYVQQLLLAPVLIHSCWSLVFLSVHNEPPLVTMPVAGVAIFIKLVF